MRNWATCIFRSKRRQAISTAGTVRGDNLFSDSLVCLDARTGKRIWHYQLVHHDIWDWDIGAPPILVDINVGGKPIKAVAQVTKQAFTFVFDRVTGKPVWPIEERPVPQSRLRARRRRLRSRSPPSPRRSTGRGPAWTI